MFSTLHVRQKKLSKYLTKKAKVPKKTSSINLDKGRRSPSPSPPSLFASGSSVPSFVPLMSIAAIVSASSSSTVAVVFVAAAWAHSVAFILLLVLLQPPTMTTIGNASSSSFLPSLRSPSSQRCQRRASPLPAPSPLQLTGSSPRWRYLLLSTQYRYHIFPHGVI